MSEPFCEFGGLPESQCAHCRENRYRMLGLTKHGTYRRPDLDMLPVGGIYAVQYRDSSGRVVPSRTGPLSAEGRFSAAVNWPALAAVALPELLNTEQPWEALNGSAAVSGFGPWTIAEFYGTCPACGYRWEPGEMIRFSEDEDGWVCSSCASSE